MRDYDLSPLYRATIGFDRLFKALESGVSASDGYPPYNIEKLDQEQYRVTIAVAGFREEDLSIVAQNNTLTVEGKLSDQGERSFLHRGIAGRAFKRAFQLADHIQVQDASLENGLLNIDLKRIVPEELKPRKIAIGGRDGQLVDNGAV